MKVLSSQESPGFTPINVALSIESRDELQALYQLGNCAHAVSEHVQSLIDVGGVNTDICKFLAKLFEELSAYHTRHC